MAVRQTLRSLTENGFQVDYVGPEIPDAEIRGLYSQTYMLEPEKRLFIRFSAGLRPGCRAEALP